MSFLDKILNNKKDDKNSNEFFFAKKKKNSEIEELIKEENIEELKKLITTQNVNEKELNSNYALYYAVIYNKKQIVDYLFSLGAKVDTAKQNITDNVTELLIDINNYEILDSFLNQKMILPRLISNVPLLHYALEKKVSFKFIKLLLENKVQIEEFKEKTALQKALEVNSDFNTIQYLIKIDTQNISIFNNDKNILEDIILSPLDNLKKIEIIKELKKQTNITLNQTTKDNKETILELAIRLKQNMVAKELILLGADFSTIKNELNSLFEKGDLEDITNYIKSENLDFINYCSILTYEEICEYFDSCDNLENSTVILNIIENPKLNLIQKKQLISLAVSKKANVNEIDERVNTTALLNYSKLIKQTTYIDLIQLLLELGAKIEICGQSAFLYAIKSYNLEILNLFIKYNANVNFVTKDNQSIANYIVEDEFIKKDENKIVELLKISIKNGLDLNTKSTFFIDEEEEILDIFSIFICERKENTIEFLLNKDLPLNDDSNYIYYAIRYLNTDSLQKRIIDLNPEYEYKNFYIIGKQTDSAQALGMAIEYKKENLVKLILESYPNMKSYCTIKETLLDLIENKFEISTIKELIKKDPDINRKYTILTSQPYTSTILLMCIKRINDIKYNKKEKYIQILEFLLQNKADPNIQEVYENEKIDSSTIFDLLVNENSLNKQLLDMIIKYGADLNIRTVVYKNSIIHNIINNSLYISDDIVISYLEYFDKKIGINLEDKNKEGLTLLLCACWVCKSKVVRWLLEKGANIHVKGGSLNANTLYTTLCTNRDVKAIERLNTIKVLIEYGADIEELSNNLTALMASCFYGTYICTEYLLQIGAKVNNKNKDNNTAVNYCVQGNVGYDTPSSVESIKGRTLLLLHKYEADLDNIPDINKSALVTTILDNKKELFDHLLQLKVDINKKDKNSITALMYAVTEGSIYFINRLLDEESLNINEVDKYNANALFFTLYRNNTNEAITIFEKLIKNDIKETLLEDQRTLLHKACEIGNIEIIPSILDFTKHDINNVDEFGTTALLSSIISNQNYEFRTIKIVKLLVQKGANINIIDKEDNHALTSAIKLKQINLVKTLLELQADINVVSREGKTAIHFLLDTNYTINELEIYLKLFDDYGIDINYNKNIDCALLYYIKSMDFSSNRSMGFLQENIKIKKEEDNIVNLLIKYKANIKEAINQAIGNNESKDIIDYLKEKGNI
ncbi:hypothetical protein CRV00_05190 [Malaciobacter molluscorum]|uniref:ankyrin repeat domain-containing protein n=1 Tax=Malaciobacter molluscorum TaxID=1032072 RepID=UPI00100A650A|nr:ankyrin repeat domain-containing protein [Malaciobacter molluscorum]RXJ95151.1 hypothetical protein CRV00_05190 [Malaciobacter molluscorum]